MTYSHQPTAYKRAVWCACVRLCCSCTDAVPWAEDGPWAEPQQTQEDKPQLAAESSPLAVKLCKLHDLYIYRHIYIYIYILPVHLKYLQKLLLFFFFCYCQKICFLSLVKKNSGFFFLFFNPFDFMQRARTIFNQSGVSVVNANVCLCVHVRRRVTVAWALGINAISFLMLPKHTHSCMLLLPPSWASVPRRTQFAAAQVVQLTQVGLGPFLHVMVLLGLLISLNL